MTLLLIRHGETALNAARVLQPADTPLSPRGQAQAQALARRLADASLAGILASDLPRALQTAQAIAAVTGLPIVTSSLLHERNYGDLRGQPYDALDFNPLAMDQAPPNGESQTIFSARCAQAWAELLGLQQRLAGPLAVVTHGLVLREWLLNHLSLGEGVVLPARMSNTSVTEAAAGPPHRVVRVDCTLHLTGTLRDDAHALSGG